jgi:hypothetical protein
MPRKQGAQNRGDTAKLGKQEMDNAHTSKLALVVRRENELLRSWQQLAVTV